MKCPNLCVFTIPQLPCAILDEAIAGLDRRYIDSIELIPSFRCGRAFCIHYARFSLNRYDIPDINPHKVRFYTLPNFPLSSKPFRFAYLAFVAAHTSNLNTTNSHHLEYICKFHHYMREAIQCSSYFEIITASYMALIFEFVQRPRQTTQFRNILIHAKGLWGATVQVLREESTRRFDVDMASVLTLFQSSLHHVQYEYFLNDASQSHKEMEIWNLMTERFEPLLTLVSRIRFFHCYWGLQPLEKCLSLGLDAFLAIRKSSANGDSEKFDSGVQNILNLSRYIINLVYESPGGREMLELAGDTCLRAPWIEHATPPFGWSRIE